MYICISCMYVTAISTQHIMPKYVYESLGLALPVCNEGRLDSQLQCYYGLEDCTCQDHFCSPRRSSPSLISLSLTSLSLSLPKALPLDFPRWWWWCHQWPFLPPLLLVMCVYRAHAEKAPACLPACNIINACTDWGRTDVIKFVSSLWAFSPNDLL